MRGDDGETGAGAGRTTRVRTGPRHAAPRKSLLTKIQVPAGKAIAIAAMPTAVLMGMGLTPRLASADELPKNPFTGTSCADTTDDTSSSGTSSSTSASSSKSASATASSSDSSATATPAPSASPSASSSAASKAEKASTPTATASPSASASASDSASASASETTNVLDPLGVGEAIKNLLGIDSTTESTSTTTASASASASATTSTATATASATAGSTKDTGSGDGSAADTVKKAVKAAASKAAATSRATSGTSSASASASSTGNPYPCATHDAEALANATTQETSSLLPDTPWTLKSDLLTLTGLDYKGIVEVTTENGTVKKVLKFTATGVDIKNLQQTVAGPNGTTAHVDAASGSTSTIRNGTVTMYTESLKGNLFGILPVTFTPDTPPPINVPVAFFTNVTVIQAGQFGGTLTVPGMHLYNES